MILAPFAIVTIFLYALGIVDRARLKELNHRLLIGRRLPAGAAALIARTFARVSATNILPAARAQIDRDLADGWRVVIATASYAFYVEPIAVTLGIATVIGTSVAHDADGAIRARIDRPNCYGPAKRTLIERWLDREGLRRSDCHIRFYSDHVSDAATLIWADEAIAVNAHPPLAALAAANGWRVEDWRLRT